jgi:hypothetical protein
MPARSLLKWLAAPALIILFGVPAFLVGPGAGAPSSPTAAEEQVTEAWVARYNGPGNGGDVAYALALDGAGNVYVTGVSWGSGTDDDYATIKYDSLGNQLWEKRYNGPGNDHDQAYALALDGAGGVYVTGQSGDANGYSDYATVKYDGASGNQLWEKRYNGPGNDHDEARALAVDEAGNVYVTGYSLGSGTDVDYATIKYVQGPAPTPTPTPTTTLTLTPTPTPTDTPTPGPVGGIAELPPLAGISADQASGPADGPGWSAGDYALAGGLAAAAVIVAGAWYARRRWLR